MNSNISEERIKDKIESLDTLQAGIVFGKEDAWDKLQARMDAKPARRRQPFYRMAAAAALVMLCIAIAAFLYQPQGHVGAFASSKPTNVSATPSIVTPAQNQPTTIIQYTATDSYPAITYTTQPLTTHHQHNPKTHETVIASLPVPSAPDTAVVAAPAPIAAAVPKMKVLHINELGKEEAPPAIDIADNNTIPHPHVQFRMKVVHINDLMRPVPTDDYLRDMSRNTAWHFPFSHKAYEDRNAGNRAPYNLLHINLSN